MLFRSCARMAYFAHSPEPTAKLVRGVCLFFIMSHSVHVLVWTMAVAFKCVALKHNHFVHALDKDGEYIEKLVSRKTMTAKLNSQPAEFENISAPVEVVNISETDTGGLFPMLKLVQYIPGLFLFLWRPKVSGKGV